MSEQIGMLMENIELRDKAICVFGSNSEQPARVLHQKSERPLDLIVEDYESLLNSKLLLEDTPDIAVKMMEFEATDYDNQTLDLVYAQASVSGINRNKIVKEIKRILKPGGLFCAGEITKLEPETPVFVQNVWNASALLPLEHNKIKDYYQERGFTVIYEKSLNSTLELYYSMSAGLIKDKKETFSEEEKQQYKKLINRISHESNVYLKQGGSRHIGFKTLLLQKNQ